MIFSHRVPCLRGHPSYFVNAIGMLPGNLPMQAISSFEWRSRIYIPLSILCHTGPRSRSEFSVRFTNTVLDRLKSPRSKAFIPQSYICDTWTYRTQGERCYLNSLAALSHRYIVEESTSLWRGQLTVDHESMSWNQVILRENFRDIKRSIISPLRHTARFERWLRSKTRYFLVPDDRGE